MFTAVFALVVRENGVVQNVGMWNGIPAVSLSLKIPIYHLSVDLLRRQRRLPSDGSLPKCPPCLGLGWDTARKQVFHVVAGPQSLEPSLGPLRACISRKLASELALNPETPIYMMGILWRCNLQG